MKNNTLFISVILFFSVLAGCQQPTEKTAEKSTQEAINELESTLFNAKTNVLDRKKANELSFLYERWAHENKDNDQAAVYLLKAADVSMNLNNPRRCIGLFDEILNNYPQAKQASSALFLKAFVYDDQLQDYVKAGEFYTEFLEKYPESPFANDAQASLKNLGKTPEELVKEFEKNQNK